MAAAGCGCSRLRSRIFSNFDPLIDAVVFSSREVEVDARFPITMPMLGSTYQDPKRDLYST